MSLFSSIPIREFSEDFQPSWVNTIRAYLVRIFPGLNASETPETIANNQSSLVDLTGLVLDSDSFHFYKIRYDIHREDDNPTEYEEVGTLECFWDGSAWNTNRIVDFGNALEDDTEGGLGTGTDYLTINGADGQAKYKSSNFSGGSYVGQLNWTIIETRLAQ